MRAPRFGRRKAVTSDALKERLTKIRLTIVSTSEKKASARTSSSGIPRPNATTKMHGNERKRERSLQQTPADQRAGEQRLIGRTRRTAHHIVLLRLGLEDERTHGIDHHLQKRDVHRARTGSASRTAAAAAPVRRSARARRR